MNNYFINITKNLNLKSLEKVDIGMFENHISIKEIHETFPNIISENFHLKEVSKDNVRKEMRNLNSKKLSSYGSIPVSILKQFVNAYLPYLTDTTNYSLRVSTFTEEIKHSEVIPVNKKLDPLKKEKLSGKIVKILFLKILTILPGNLRKLSVYWKFPQHQIRWKSLYFTRCTQKINYQNVWHVLTGKYVSGLFMDLSKSFDAQLIMTSCSQKLKVYGFSLNAVKLMRTYLINRKQQVSSMFCGYLAH